MRRSAAPSTLAGSVIALDTAVRNLVGTGLPLRGRGGGGLRRIPRRCCGASDRGAIEVGVRAHLVELTDDLRVRRVTRGHAWVAGAA